MRRLALLAIVVLGAMGALAGCSDGGNDAGAPPEGVSVELVQLRSDVAARQAQVMVTNGTSAPIEVGDVQVEDGRFSGDAARVVDRTSRIVPGSTVGIRVQLAPVRCPSEPGVAIVWMVVDGVHTSLPIADAGGFVAPLHERECRAARLAATADVAFTAFVPSAPGSPADLQLTLAPTGDAAAVVSSIARTNLLTFEGAADDLFALDARITAGDTEPIVVHLPLVPLRCDPHAVQEDKRGTVFDLAVEVGDDDGTIELAASEDMRGEILTWVTRWCGYGS